MFYISRLSGWGSQSVASELIDAGAAVALSADAAATAREEAGKVLQVRGATNDNGVTSDSMGSAMETLRPADTGKGSGRTGGGSAKPGFDVKWALSEGSAGAGLPQLVDVGKVAWERGPGTAGVGGDWSARFMWPRHLGSAPEKGK